MSDNRTIEIQRRFLYEVLASLDTPEKVESFLADLCTDNEIDYMAQRNECARLLLEGYTYQQVVGRVNISSATLSRISRCVKRGNGGYNILLAKILEDKKDD